ncbi:probable receptor-like protein kinase At1g80640 isoform X2 [Quercus lobata]|uniref:probable receptor-like protein kinase At1g80640 isoform X2 n=1 Tax=Quercus lobata TaxID=97700 RepID=UPI0012448B33|nr:probable receptor-like protein kinase At1g80640 isoform X2 [Quercus lobata]
MNLLSCFSLLLIMWILSNTLFSAIIDARSEPPIPVPSISEQFYVAERIPSSQFLVKMEAEPPGPGEPEIRVVHHHYLNEKILIALIVASSLLGGILLFLLLFWIYRQKKLKNSNKKSRKSLEAAKGISMNPIMVNSLRMANSKGSLAIFDYPSLEAATNNFQESNHLSEGGCGHIYKAHFDEKLLAAVKRIDGITQDMEREFENEVNWLSKIQHQNIIKLFGYCIYGDSRFLVYEMMEKASLETQLHGPTQGSALTWHLRMKIAVDVARGLEYLHEHSHPPVVHRDIKSSNILLDSNFNAKLSDFGLAVTSGTENNNLKLSGTMDYVAPEYLLDVVLLELLTGRKPLENLAPAQCLSIVTWAMPQLTDRSKLPKIVDPVIRNMMDLKHLYQVAAVAVLCVQTEPSYRPLITDILHSLIPLVPNELGGSLRVTEPTKPVCPGPSN